MKTIEDFESYVIAYAPYTPAEYVQFSIREAIIDFMRETRCAKDVLEVETQEKVPDYMLETPDCRRIVRVTSVMQSPLKCSGRENWSVLHDGEFGDYSVELRRGEHPIILLTNPPRNPHRLKIEYVWTIGRGDCEVPDFIFDDYMDGIIAGALVRLSTMPGNEYLANGLRVYSQNWINAIQQAKIDKTNGKAKRIIGAPFLTGRRARLWR